MAADGPILQPVVAMTQQAALRLLSAGEGDATLFYLALLTKGQDFSGARQTLSWSDERARAAYTKLAALRLVPDQVPEDPTRPLAQAEEPPEYTGADIARELEHSPTFSGLIQEVQRRLGKVLSTADLKTLYTLYDYLALPAEVILLAVNWCVGETERKYGVGRKPRLSQIKKEAFAWHRQGVDTAEQAETHLKRLAALQSREAQILPLLGITGRLPVEGERKYMSGWVEMGFEDDAIRLAYEKTVLKKQSLSWPYMNSILRSWHQKGLHTAQQVEQGDSSYRRPATTTPAGGATTGDSSTRLKQDMERMERFLAQTQREEE